jgi:hypothetical protein
LYKKIEKKFIFSDMEKIFKEKVGIHLRGTPKGPASFEQLFGFSSLWQPEIWLPPVLETLDDFYCTQ